MREAETAVLMFEGAWVVDRRIQVNLAKYKCRDNYWRKKHPQGVPRVAAHQINRLCGDDTGRRANENVRLPASHKPSYLGKNVDKKNPVVLETSSSESSASSDQVEKPASPGEKLFETNEALNDASLEIPSNNCASIQVEFAARSVEKSNLVGCRTEANLEGSGVGGFSNKGLSDGSTKSQCKEHGPKWVDVVKGGAARLPYSDPKEGSPCLNQAVADLNSVGLQGIDLSKNDDVELDVNRAADEDPKNICPGGAVMAQEMLVDNLVVSIGSKEVEREELSGRISPVLEHRKMDHVTLELPEFQSITKPGRVKRVWNCRFVVYWNGVNGFVEASKKWPAIVEEHCH
ncbi:hypothetical protein V6N12_033396 [Hibiscus sabdariffa]|uniref:Uncharacterized protein n=1 Tax=Hibiscus sabdariffa TaxID=183260 RepID=A0ABR2BVM0_9ROSI